MTVMSKWREELAIWKKTKSVFQTNERLAIVIKEDGEYYFADYHLEKKERKLRYSDLEFLKKPLQDQNFYIWKDRFAPAIIEEAIQYVEERNPIRCIVSPYTEDRGVSES